MSKKIKLSYVLPCYNIEKYIEECINSIYQQGLMPSDFEIICVNDCSPDNTRQIILELQKKYENLILIDHEKNRRVGAARNTGFYKASGEYIWFIDPDDILVANSAKYLLKILDEEKLDFIQFGHDWMTEAKEPINEPPFNHNYPYETGIISGFDFIREYIKKSIPYSNMHVGCFTRIYRRQYLVDNKIIFPEVAYYEDQYQALHGLIAATRMLNLNKSFYQYRVIENSYSHMEMSVPKRAAQLIMSVQMDLLLENYGANTEIRDFVWKRYDEDLKYLKTHYVLFMNNDNRELFVNLIKNELKSLYRLMPESGYFLTHFPNIYLFISKICSPILRKIRKLKRK